MNGVSVQTVGPTAVRKSAEPSLSVTASTDEAAGPYRHVGSETHT
jgi:hypothetical protein